MKKFVKDYMELLNMNVKFYRNHWKGCVTVYAVICGIYTSFMMHRFQKYIDNTDKETSE